MRPSSGSSSSDSLSVFAARVSASWRVMVASWTWAVRREPSAAAAALTNTSPSWSSPPKHAQGRAPESTRTSSPTAISWPAPAAASGASAAVSAAACSRSSPARGAREATKSSSAGRPVTSCGLGGRLAGPGRSRRPGRRGRPRTARAAARTAPRRTGRPRATTASRTSPGSLGPPAGASRRDTASTASEGLQSLGSTGEALQSLLDARRQAFTLVGAAGPECARPRRGGRVAEGTRLLSEYGAASSIAGSNPALSAGRPCRNAVARLSVPLRP